MCGVAAAAASTIFQNSFVSLPTTTTTTAPPAPAEPKNKYADLRDLFTMEEVTTSSSNTTQPSNGLWGSMFMTSVSSTKPSTNQSVFSSMSTPSVFDTNSSYSNKPTNTGISLESNSSQNQPQKTAGYTNNPSVYPPNNQQFAGNFAYMPSSNPAPFQSNPQINSQFSLSMQQNSNTAFGMQNQPQLQTMSSGFGMQAQLNQNPAGMVPTQSFGIQQPTNTFTNAVPTSNPFFQLQGSTAPASTNNPFMTSQTNVVPLQSSGGTNHSPATNPFMNPSLAPTLQPSTTNPFF